MAHYVYVIRSGESQYVGVTKDLKDRLSRHNSGSNKSTKHRKKWKLFYFKAYNTLAEARSIESHIKRSKKRWPG